MFWKLNAMIGCKFSMFGGRLSLWVVLGFFFSLSWTKNKFKSCGAVLVLLDTEWLERTSFRREFGYLHAHLYEHSWTSTWLPGKCCLIFLLSSDYIGPIIILLILGPAVHKWITSCQLYDRLGSNNGSDFSDFLQSHGRGKKCSINLCVSKFCD